ncbi:MAG: hypothetical protein ACHQXA_01135 [Gemmatimonadales bacterium]
MLSKRLTLVALAAALVAGGGCAKVKAMLGRGGVNQDSLVQAHLAQARRDSLAKAQEKRDSVARVRFVACNDSVEKVLKKTAVGRKVLAGKAKLPAGMLLPPVLKACGVVPPPKPAAPAVTAAKPTVPVTVPPTAKPGAPAVTAGKPVPVTTAPANGKPGLPAPTLPAGKQPVVQTPAAPAAKPAPALTAAQLRVARADSIRKVKDAAHADSLAKAKEKARTDSLARVRADSVRQDSLRLAKETEVLRETFAYTGGNRDPFQSLIQHGSSSVEFGDLVLIGIYQDMRSARNSVALLRDKQSGKRYKVRVGDKIGSRMTVAQIGGRDVTFTIQDFGFERQETLSLSKKAEEETP